MNKILSILASLVSVTTLAQDAQNTNNEGKPALKVHYEKISICDDGMTLTNVRIAGDMHLKGEVIELSGPVKLKMGEKNQDNAPANKEIVVANNVEITGGNSVLKADQLSYDRETQTGILLGHITITENGIKKRVGKRAEVDFCNNEYRIVSIR